MVIGRIEVGVIANPPRKLHCDILLRVKHAVTQSGIIPQSWRIGGKQMLNGFPRFAPNGASKDKKIIQRISREKVLSCPDGRSRRQISRRTAEASILRRTQVPQL